MGLITENKMKTHAKETSHIDHFGECNIGILFHQASDGTLVTRIFVGIIAFDRVLAQFAQIRVAFFYTREQCRFK